VRVVPGGRGDEGTGGRRRRRAAGVELLVNGGLLALMPALLLAMAWVSYWAWAPRWIACMMLALVVTLRLVATRFSQGVLRAFTVAAIVVSIGGLLSVGRSGRIEARARAGRATANRLAVESAQVRADVGGPGSVSAANETAVAATAQLRRDSPVTKPPPAVASEIASELEAGLQGSATESSVQRAVDLQSRLAADPSLASAGGPTGPLVREAAAAIAAYRQLVAIETLDQADDLIAATCRELSGAIVDDAQHSCRPRPGAPDTGTDTNAHRRQLAVNQARAGLLLAEAAKAGGRGDPGAVDKALDSRRQALAKALAEREDDTPSTDFLVVLREGGNALVRSLPLVNRRGVPLSLAVVGWVILAGVGIMGYRHFEIINGDGGLGPVTVPGDDNAAARFRTYLLWNVPEPGAVPGASSLKPVTDLLGAATGGVPGAQWLQKILEALTAAITIDHGYTVEFSVLEEGTADTQTSVCVRVRMTRTTEMLGQHVTFQRTTKEATREAAYWAAAVILSRSPKVPEWAAWDKETSESLAAYFHAPDEGTASIKLLRDAVKRAPGSGILGLKLANDESLAGNHLRAFQLALRVATMHPRYVAGRYRLAATANLLAADPTTCWDSASAADQAAVLDALDRYVAPTGDLVTALKTAPGSDPASDPRTRELSRFALRELERLCRDTSASRVMVKALRLRERTYWYGLLHATPGTKSLRAQFEETFQSCMPAVRARGGMHVTSDDLAGLERRVADPGTLWLVAYNLACYHAIRHDQEEKAGSPGSIDHVAEAVRLLETALERPGAHQLTHAWASKDPDLECLRGHQRFDRFLAGLPKNDAQSDEP
jgi:hypothetical protein